MAIAHVCVNCGRDLARVRPTPEPHYGLNLITCPQCGVHCVRRAHPVWGGWHRVRRTGLALGVLGARVFITLVLTGLNVFAVMGMLAIWNDMHSKGHMPREAAAFFVLMLSLLAVLTGVWLTAGFEHVARWKMWAGWLAWIALLLLVICQQGPLGQDIDPRGWIDDAPSTWRWMFEGVVFVALPATMAAILMLLAALPGIAVGRGLLWLTRIVRRARWRARYRKAHVAMNTSWE